jgi:hypothetical protein
MAVLLIAAPSAALAAAPASVPEPSTLAILAAGLAGAALIKFKKRK